jgi:hypothetical protein
VGAAAGLTGQADPDGTIGPPADIAGGTTVAQRANAVASPPSASMIEVALRRISSR